MKNEKHFSATNAGKALRLALLLLLLIYLQTLPSLFSNRADRSAAARPAGTPDFRLALDGGQPAPAPVPAPEETPQTMLAAPESPIITLAAKAPEEPAQAAIPYEQSAYPRTPEVAATGYDPKKETATYTKPRVSVGSSTGAVLLANAAAFLMPNPNAVGGGGFGSGGASGGGGGGGSYSGGASLVPLPFVSP